MRGSEWLWTAVHRKVWEKGSPLGMQGPSALHWSWALPGGSSQALAGTTLLALSWGKEAGGWGWPSCGHFPSSPSSLPCPAGGPGLAPYIGHLL